MTLLHLWDQAMANAVSQFTGQAASPQVIYRIKKEVIRIMRDDHHLTISPEDSRKIGIEFLENGAAVNLVVPPNLLAKTLHQTRL